MIKKKSATKKTGIRSAPSSKAPAIKRAKKDPASKKIKNATAPADAKALALMAAQAAFDKKAFDVVVIDVAGLSPIADMMVIASVRSSTNLRSAAIHVEQELAKAGFKTVARETGRDRDSTWILLDFFDVLVHLLLSEQRAHYKLESLYKDARVVAQFH